MSIDQSTVLHAR